MKNLVLTRNVVWRCNYKGCAEVLKMVSFEEFNNGDNIAPSKRCTCCQKEIDNLRIMRKWIKSRERG